MNNIARFTAAGLLSLALAGCAEYGPKETVGTVAGAGVGGLLGSFIGHGGPAKAAATGAGVLIGGLIGNQIGRSLDRADRNYAESTSQQALEYNRSGEPSEWRNPDSGNYGTVTPERTYEDNYGRYCREYQQTIFVGGEPQQAYGTACRQPDGSWQVVNDG
ncbi:MAG: RT0821/Lpp0805 family surface protein [Dongiaceae bacterium]